MTTVVKNKLDAIVMGETVAPTATVIWLHGLGASGDDFAAFVPLLNLPASLKIKFIFPHAPLMPVTLNAGMVMPAWYDILGLALDTPQDSAGIKATYDKVCELIAAEIAAGVPSSRIIIAGFSQGGAIALFTGLRYPQPLGGILALSTYLPLHEELATLRDPVNQQIPIFMAHGLQDDLLPLIFSTVSRDYLLAWNYNIEWRSYPMDHSVCLPEVQDIAKWLTAQLSGKE